MKAEERHKLKTNELAAWIANIPRKLEENQRTIAVVLVVIILGLAGWWFYHYRADTQRDQAWGELMLAWGDENVEQLATVAEEYSSVEPVAALAEYCRGLKILGDASRQGMVQNKAGYAAALDSAAGAFRAVLDKPYHPLATAGARLNLARIARDRDDRTEARQFLQQIVDDPKASPQIVGMAHAELNALDTDGGDVAFVDAPVRSSTTVTPSSPVKVPEIERSKDPLDAITGPSLSPETESTAPIPPAPEGPGTGEPNR